VFRGAVFGVGTHIGSNVDVTFFAELQVGKDCHIERDVTFEVGRVWERCRGLTIGDRVWISRGCLIRCAGRVQIGDDVLVGEFTSIRDTRHGQESVDLSMRSQPDVIGEIRVENNVWIGRGCLILGRPEGIVLGAGSVLGANSVVTRSIPANTVWGGVPARFLRNRVNDLDTKAE
jgi:acetyltransferase-like isoleucine patch superfamily enzyme